MDPAVPTVPGYDVLERLGQGTSGEVWRARRRADQLTVALKVVAVAEGRMGEALREVAALSRVRHRHLLHLYDVVPLPGAGGRPLAIAQAVQLATGGSLGTLLAGQETLAPGELVTVAAPLAGALADLHRAGVVHGRVSVGNVLFSTDGMPVLGDVGLSRVAGQWAPAGSGTDGMVAPELLEGFPAAAESDVYALGAVAWRCLTGRVPGPPGTRAALADLSPEVPPGMRAVVERCLAPEPADRPEASEVAVALLDAAPAQPVPLARSGDTTAALAQQVRAEALRKPPPAAVAGRRVHPRALRRGPSGEPRRRARRVRRGSWSRAFAGLLTAAALAVAVLVTAGSVLGGGHGVAALFDQDRTDGTATGEGMAAVAPRDVVASTRAAAPGGPPTGPPAQAAEAPPADPGTMPADGRGAPVSAPLGEAEALLQPLLQARARAWATGRVVDLQDSHAPGSAAWAHDRAALGQAAARGLTYRGLSFTVERARIERRSDDALQVVATVRRSPFRVEQPAAGGSTRTRVLPGSTERVRFGLVRTAGGWRLESWS